MKNTTETSALSLLANDAGYDPLEDRLRENIRSTIEAVAYQETNLRSFCAFNARHGQAGRLHNASAPRPPLQSSRRHVVSRAAQGEGRLGRWCSRGLADEDIVALTAL